MNTMKKRILSGIIASACAASMYLPAFAADEPATTNMDTEIIATYSAPVISVTVPANGTAVINPFGLGMEVTESDNQTKHTVAGQIATAPLFITNESTLNLSVGASVVGTVTERDDDGAPLKFATATTKGSGTEGTEGYVPAATAKSAFVKLQVADSTITSTNFGTASLADLTDEIIPEYIKDASWTNAKEIVVGLKAAEGENLATLKAAGVDTAGDPDKYAAGSIVLFRLTGDCTESPKIPWDAKDGFKVNIAFTFKIAPAAPSTGD